ncbi:MAG: hypothetical protein WBQ21_01230 [Solirubrobacteraceae bacterium]
MLQTQLFALALAATALAVSGCGGSSKAGSTTTVATAPVTTTTPATTTSADTPAPTTAAAKVATGKPLTRAKLIAQGDAICARANTKLSAVSIASYKEFPRVLPQVALYNTIELKELSKLVPPASLTSDWARIISSDQLYSEYINRIANYAQANNYSSATPLIHTAESIHKQLTEVAKRAGFKHCSQIG